MKNIPLQFQNQEIRTFNNNGQLLFVGKDICHAIGYDRRVNILRRLSANQQMQMPVQTPGGRQNMTLVTESGMQTLVKRSVKPEARVFIRWMSNEVLPQIRKQGFYTPPVKACGNLPALCIDNTTIRENQGRYCLNDLHELSGGAVKNQPFRFARLDQTRALVDEIIKSPDMVNINSEGAHPLISVPGRTGGTYACRELVIAYAMWISPAFNLKVLRAFDRMVANTGVSEVRPPARVRNPVQDDEVRMLVTIRNGQVVSSRQLTDETVIRTDALDVLRKNLFTIQKQIDYVHGEQNVDVMGIPMVTHDA